MRPMLATPAGPGRGLPDDPDRWAYEVKWDGMRVLADLRDGAVRLVSRTGRDITVAFPEVQALAGAHPDVLLDGEIIVMSHGTPSFRDLAERIHVREARKARELAARSPATLVVFDALRLYGVDLIDRAWQERRESLERLTPSGDACQLSPVYTHLPALLEATLEQGLEGVMAKRRSSRYQPGVRSPDWLKFAHRQSQTCVVGGWRPEKGSAKRIGALLVGAWGEDADGSRRLHYAGRVGSGITDAGQGDLRRLLAAAGAEESPFADAVPKADADGASWARPEVVVEVRHTGWTPGGRLRQPVFRGLRLDATPDAAALPPERVLRQPADEAGVG